MAGDGDSVYAVKPPVQDDGARSQSRLEVLNLGLFRTGTSSLRQALMDLGYENVYHMDTIFTTSPQDSKAWTKAFEYKFQGKGKPFVKDDFDKLLCNFQAVTDLPAAAFSEELIAAYPSAKVILTVRDSADIWCEAVERTVWHVHRQSPFAAGKLLGSAVADPFLPSLFRMGRRMFHCLFDDDFARTGRDVYDAHCLRLRRLVPAERLLVFNVKQGWGPLCKFLGKRVPEHGFPHLNEGREVVEKVLAKQAALRARLKCLGYVLGGLLIVVVWVAVFVGKAIFYQ